MIKRSEARESDPQASPCRFTAQFQNTASGLAEVLQSLSRYDSDRALRSGALLTASSGTGGVAGRESVARRCQSASLLRSLGA